MEEQDTRFAVGMTHLGVSAGTGVFDVHDYEEPYRLTFNFEERVLDVVAEDYFEAMRSIRRILEPQGYRFLCYGASRNCYPSPMARDMGDGSVVYKMKLGFHAQTRDLVNMFATGDDIQVSTVEEQDEFYRDWVASLGR